MYFYVNVILEAPPTPKSYKYMDWKWDYKIKSEILINSCKIYLAWPSVQLVHSGLWIWWRRSRCFSLTQCCGWLGLHVHCKWPQSYHCLGPRKLLSPEKKTKRFLSRTNLIEDLQMLKKIVRGFLTVLLTVHNIPVKFPREQRQKYRNKDLDYGYHSFNQYIKYSFQNFILL